MYFFGRWAQCVCLCDLAAQISTFQLPPAWHREASYLYTRVARLQAHSDRQRHPANRLFHSGAAACGLGGWLPVRLPPGAAPAPRGLRAQRERGALGHAGRAGRWHVLADVRYARASDRGRGGLLTRCAVHAGKVVRPAGPRGPFSLRELQDQGPMLAGTQPACIMGGCSHGDRQLCLERR